MRSSGAATVPRYARSSGQGSVARRGAYTPPPPTVIDEPEAFVDPEAPAEIDAMDVAPGAVAGEFDGWTKLTALECFQEVSFDTVAFRYLHDDAETSDLILETVQDYRNVEVSFMGKITTVYLRLHEGRAYYCTFNIFGGGIRAGIATGVTGDESTETRIDLAFFENTDIDGYPDTFPEKEDAMLNKRVTFGASGHDIYIKWGDDELVRFPCILHANVSGKIAIRNHESAGYGMHNARVTLVPAVLYNNETLDLRDLGCKSTDMDSIPLGSISSGSALLTLDTEEHGFVEGDVLIVEPPQGRGEVGPGGRWPEVGYANSTLLQATTPSEDGTCAVDESTGHVWMYVTGSGWDDLTLDPTEYYFSAVSPKPLVATVLAVDGANITLDTTAEATTTGARVFVEAFDELRGLISQPASYPKAYPPEDSVNVAAVWQPLELQFPAGSFATASGPLRMLDNDGFTIEGDGRDSTILYTPNYCESTGWEVYQATASRVAGFGVRGTFQMVGTGWDMSTDIRPFGHPTGSGPNFPRSFHLSGCTGSEMEDVASTNGWHDASIGFSSDCSITGLRVTHTDPAQMYMGTHVTTDNAVDSVIECDEFDSAHYIDAAAHFGSSGCTMTFGSVRNGEIHCNGAHDCIYEAHSVYEAGARFGTFAETALQLAMFDYVNHIGAGNVDGNIVRNSTFVSYEPITVGWRQYHAFTGGQLLNTRITVAAGNAAFTQPAEFPSDVAIEDCVFAGGEVILRAGSITNSSGPELNIDTDVATLGSGNDFDVVEEL